MNERTALAVIDRDYGSLEDFVIALLNEKREALDPEIPMVKRAELAGLPLPVFSRIISSSQFRQLLRVDLVNSLYNHEAEAKHVEKTVGVATGEPKRVMSASGNIGEVDQAPGDMIAAGKYLNELRGTPIEKAQQQAPSIVINIAGPGQVDSDDQATIDVDVDSYRPQKAGGLPPPGVRARSGEAVSGDELPAAHLDAGLSSFYGEDAQEEDEDHRIAQKQAGAVDQDDESLAKKRWGKNRVQKHSLGWPGRGVPPDRAASVYGEDEK